MVERGRLAAEERESARRNEVVLLIFCENMFMNVLDLKNHVNFRKERRGQGLLPRREKKSGLCVDFVESCS